ncbi:MAG: helix-turn-helix domain-containing protein [Betaproteobacteria bacterium]|nr:helix-turn-helix domain-containing protein [Betaproteobacteria bacterium]
MDKVGMTSITVLEFVAHLDGGCMVNSPNTSSETQGASLASNVKYLRKELSLSQEQLSERSGIPRSTIASLERGEGNPTLQVLMGVARGLGVTISELLAQRQPRATFFPSQTHGRTQYPLEIAGVETSTRAVETLRLTPAQMRYLVIEELVLEGLETILSPAHPAGTEEHFFVVEGSCEVEVNGETYRVGQGDLLRFDGDQKHLYRGVGKGKRARGFAVVVQVPRV